MVEANIIGRTDCPWCHNELEVVKSPKSGHHYANCTSCNSHFRNIPVALVDMKGKQIPQAEPEIQESALERLRKGFGQNKQETIEGGASSEGGDALDKFLRKYGHTAEPKVRESAVERLRRGYG